MNLHGFVDDMAGDSAMVHTDLVVDNGRWSGAIAADNRQVNDRRQVAKRNAPTRSVCSFSLRTNNLG